MSLLGGSFYEHEEMGPRHPDHHGAENHQSLPEIDVEEFHIGLAEGEPYIKKAYDSELIEDEEEGKAEPQARELGLNGRRLGKDGCEENGACKEAVAPVVDFDPYEKVTGDDLLSDPGYSCIEEIEKKGACLGYPHGEGKNGVVVDQGDP